VSWQAAYLDRYYNRARGWVDGTAEFHDLVAGRVPPGARILEIGAGPPNPTTRFLATLGELHGVDPDPAVLHNDALVSARLLEGDRLPHDDARFDACVSNFVVEHVADPARHLAEVSRVLKPGAPYLFRTPNRFHYVTLVSSLTPHGFHVRVANRLRGLAEESHDPYPTVYALNSRRAIRRRAREADLDLELLRLIEKDPSYGMSSRLLFLAFMTYERIVNASDLLQDLRSAILCVLRKPASG
jgi:SAM-dependent methyltransferase